MNTYFFATTFLSFIISCNANLFLTPGSVYNKLTIKQMKHNILRIFNKLNIFQKTNQTYVDELLKNDPYIRMSFIQP